MGLRFVSASFCERLKEEGRKLEVRRPHLEQLFRLSVPSTDCTRLLAFYPLWTVRDVPTDCVRVCTFDATPGSAKEAMLEGL